MKQMIKFAKFAQAIILSVIALIVLLILYQVYDKQARYIGMDEFLVYFLFPTASLIILIVASKLSDPYTINFTLALMSIGITLYAIEGGVTLFNPLFVSEIHKTTPSGEPFDIRSPLEVITQFEEKDIEAVPVTCPIHLVQRASEIKIDPQVLPLGGVSNALTVYCNESGDYTIYHSDEHGFHNPKGLYNGAQLDMAVVGDSFAQGACVTSEENAVAFIRNVYPNTLNLGCKGNGPLISLATLKEYARPFEPKVILWFYYEENDLNDLKRAQKSDILLNYLVEDYGQNLLSKQPEIDQILHTFIEDERLKTIEANNYSLYKFLVMTNLRLKLRFYPGGWSHLKYPQAFDPDDLELFRQAVLTARDTVEFWGGDFYFVYLPAWGRFDNDSEADFYREEVLQMINDLEILTIDIYPIFKAHPDPLSLFPFREHNHYTAEGYQLVAETVLQFLAEKED